MYIMYTSLYAYTHTGTGWARNQLTQGAQLEWQGGPLEWHTLLKPMWKRTLKAHVKAHVEAHIQAHVKTHVEAYVEGHVKAHVKAHT